MAGRDNRFRIIAGQWRGRKFSFPDVNGLRPTPDRVREMLFNWLQPVISGARCLDLYTGSGALGLEALSRGAASAVFVDSQANVIRQIREDLHLVNCDAAQLLQRDVLAYLNEPATEFDIVFLDPPFRQGLIKSACRLLEASGWLAPRAHIYLEMETELAAPDLPQNWQLIKEKQTGQVRSLLAQRP